MTSEKRKEYNLLWKQANKEHVKEYQKKYRVRARIENPELKTKSDTKTYYKHREERLAKDKIYRNENRELVRERANLNALRYRESHKEEITARTNLNHALEKGLVERDTKCLNCSTSVMLQAHHDDYTKSLKVQWYCTACHGAYHHNKSRFVDLREELRNG